MFVNHLLKKKSAFSSPFNFFKETCNKIGKRESHKQKKKVIDKLSAKLLTQTNFFDLLCSQSIISNLI